MLPRYLQAVMIGVIAGVVLVIAYLIFIVIGFAGGFVVPFLSCAIGCIQWLSMAAFLVGVGWFTANYTWATTRGDAIRLAAVTGVVAGAISQSFGLILGLLLSPIIGLIGGVIGYLMAGDYNPVMVALLTGTAALTFALVIVVIQFLFWVALSVISCALGGAMYSAQAVKRQG